MEKIIDFMFSGIFQFVGIFLLIALLLGFIQEIWKSFFNFLSTIFKKEKNNFYISKENIDKEFIEELKKYSKGEKNDCI